MILRVVIFSFLFGILCGTAVFGSGHGPVFGLATPTNAKNGWSFDSGLMGRKGKDSGLMFREMASYGITEDLQVSFSAPWVFESAPFSAGRQTAMMPGTFDFEGILGWRFHRQGTDVGTRRESTLYAGVIVPSGQRIGGMLGDLKRSPGFFTGIVTGMASRSHYLWGGVSYTRFNESEGDRRPDILFYSFVWGYRPSSWRKDYPHWDWRFFAEFTGERSSKVISNFQTLAGTGGNQIFLGPTTLGIYKNIAIEGGFQLPIYRDIGFRHQKEKFRYALNFSYFY